MKVIRWFIKNVFFDDISLIRFTVLLYDCKCLFHLQFVILKHTRNHPTKLTLFNMDLKYILLKNWDQTQPENSLTYVYTSHQYTTETLLNPRNSCLLANNRPPRDWDACASGLALRHHTSHCTSSTLTNLSNVLLIKMEEHNLFNKRAQRALGRSPEEKVKGHSVANNREPQGHNLNNFGRGPFDDVIY